MLDYRKERPRVEESERDYARRLEGEGHDEMFIRKALRAHFLIELRELADFFEDFQIARMRHVAMVAKLRRYPNDDAFADKVSKNLGIELSRAEELVRRFRSSETGG